ncbi:aldo/keto reductase [Chloroflexota bacterium]
MKYNQLNSLEIELSSVGLGGWQLGGHGWGKISEPETIRVVHKAIDCGINFFDTAPVYGLGRSEEILGKALGVHRKEVIIATKVGLIWNKGETFTKSVDNSPANIEKEIEMSLKRLGTDYIDLYQIHWPDPDTSLEVTLLALEKLKKAGKIRYIGCCNFFLELLKESVKYGGIKTVQIPYNLVDRKAENDILPFCRENDIAVIAYSPIARGLLAGKYDENTEFESGDHRSRGGDEYFQGESFPKNLAIVEKVRLIGQKFGKTPAQVALRWVLQNPCVTAAIFGAKNIAQVEENVEVSDFSLSKEDMEFLEEDV